MKTRDNRILKLLETLQEKPSQNQRALAGSLKLSLGMVNKLISELAVRGVIKTDKRGRNKIRYILTPKGIAEKIVLKKRQLSYYIDCYNKIKREVKLGLRQLKGKSENYIVFYGTGDLCEIACMIFGKSDRDKIMVVDDNKAGSTINGFSIYQEAEMENMSYDAVMIMGLDNAKKVRSKLISKGIPSSKIFQILTQGGIDNCKN